MTLTAVTNPRLPELKPIGRSTIESLISMIGATSNDPTRYSIGYLRIESTERGALLTATNGHMLAEREIECEGLASMKTIAFLHRDQLAALKLINKQLNGMSIHFERGPQDQPVIGRIGLCSPVALEYNVDYPDYQAIKPKETDDGIEIGLNAALLDQLATALKKDRKQNSIIKLKIRGKMDAIKVTMGDDTYGLLMPCRL